MSLARLPAKAGTNCALLRFGRCRPRFKCKATMSDVPTTWREVQTTFVKHPSAAVPIAAIAILSLARSQEPLTLVDVPVAAGVVGFWLIQEWVVHKLLLHSSWEWVGKRIHEEHHQTTYFQVSLDPPWLILSVMAIAAVVFWLLFQGGPLWLTATAAYYAAGLAYEWLHYVVHTHWVPPATGIGGWLRSIRRHHMLHHMRNEDYWLSFSAPSVDKLFGTLPASGSSVPLSEMARKAHGVQAGKTVSDVGSMTASPRTVEKMAHSPAVAAPVTARR